MGGFFSFVEEKVEENEVVCSNQDLKNYVCAADALATSGLYRGMAQKFIAETGAYVAAEGNIDVRDCGKKRYTDEDANRRYQKSIRAAVEHGCLPEDWKATLIADGVLDSYTAVDESVGRSKLFKELTEEEKDMVDIF